MTSGEDKDIDMGMVDMEHDVSYVLHTRILLRTDLILEHLVLLDLGFLRNEKVVILLNDAKRNKGMTS